MGLYRRTASKQAVSKNDVIEGVTRAVAHDLPVVGYIGAEVVCQYFFTIRQNCGGARLRHER